MKEQIIAILTKYHIKKIWHLEEESVVAVPDKTAKEDIADEIISLFDAKMPSEEETIVEAENLYPTVYKNDGLNKIDDAYNHMQLDKRIGFKQGCEWFRNRMEESK